MVREFLAIALSLLLAVTIAGCGSSSSSSGSGSSGSSTCVNPGAAGQGSIVFESQNALDCSNSFGPTAVWIASSSGQMPLSQTFTLPLQSRPAWSPDGTRIAFARTGPNVPALNIWVINPDGSNAVNLTNTTTLNQTTNQLPDAVEPAWSPDGKKIAFLSNKALDGSNGVVGSGFNIWVINADGSGQLPLTRDTTVIHDHPAWSPDSTKIASDGIMVMNADGTGAISLLRGTRPQWSQDGTTLAFESNIDPNGSGLPISGASNVWVMKADGSAAGPLTKLTVAMDPVAPQWSPDGTMLVFSSQGALDGSNALNNSANIWTVKGDGLPATPLTRLTAVGSDSFAPAWSANGKQIAFSSGRALDGSNGATATCTVGPLVPGCPTNIWVMNADGSSPTPLTRSTSFLQGMDPIPVQNNNPRWHP